MNSLSVKKKTVSFKTPSIKKKNEEIHWDKRDKCLKKKGIRYRGITKLQKFAFYPKYNYFQLQKSIKSTVNEMSTKPKIQGSMKLGTSFDISVQKSVKLFKQYSLKPSHLYDFSSVKPTLALITSEADKKIYLSFARLKNPYLSRFWLLVEKNNWTPVDTQVPCCSGKYHIATMADLIVRDKENKLMVIELKTGFEGYWKLSVGKMNKPFDFLDDSPWSQHQLQLMATQSLIAETYPNQKFRQGYIIQFESYQTVQQQLDSRLKDPKLITQMFEQMNLYIRMLPT